MAVEQYIITDVVSRMNTSIKKLSFIFTKIFRFNNNVNRRSNAGNNNKFNNSGNRTHNVNGKTKWYVHFRQ